MRRLVISALIFSMFLSGCRSPFIKPAEMSTERTSIAFKEWVVPNFFISKQIRVVGLGDSLTQGVGDELKKEGYFGRLTTEMFEWKGVKNVKTDNLAKRGSRSEQLNKKLEDPDVKSTIEKADIILITIGGNDLMKVVKKNIFNLKKDPFYDELQSFETNLDELYGTIRGLNSDAIIVLAGLYNPLTLVTNEANDFEGIIVEWNKAIEARTVIDSKSCFVPVTDLFDSNTAMVYHTDFFHPNANGYNSMSKRFMEKIKSCDLRKLSDGELDM